MKELIIVFTAVLIGLVLALFNLAGVAITLVDRKLRGRVSNYPIVSFLVASTLQGAFAAPIYFYKQMEHTEHLSGWLCDLSRTSYYLCHHLVKVSFIIVSFDRLLSIKFHFKYQVSVLTFSF